MNQRKLITFLSLIYSSFSSFIISTPKIPFSTLNEDSSTGNPSVLTSYGTFVGTSNDKTESFLGIPFASPPTGNLRFQPPIPPSIHYGTYDASSYGPACPQLSATAGGAFQNIPPALAQEVVGVLQENGLIGEEPVQDEDCLMINVIRPKGVIMGKGLPILFWIYGGGFGTGYSQSADGKLLVERSIEISEPIIYVSANYRVNSFGFLPYENKTVNAGLFDQRLAMKWIQKHIRLFGGDPKKVTIAGESAGSISIGYQLIAYGETSTDLFRAAILQSGSPIPILGINTTSASWAYDTLVEAARGYCSLHLTDFECLQSISWQELQNATNALPYLLSFYGVHLPFLPRLDEDLLPASAIELYEKGDYLKVPIISGNQYDEGTLLCVGALNITEDADVDSYIKMIYPQSSEAFRQTLMEYYSNDVTLGSPFDTGVENNVTGQNKRINAIIGDTLFQDTRRVLLSYLSKTQNVWSYSDRALISTHLLGSYHSADVGLLLGTNPVSPSTEFQDRWISFVSNLDPNPASGDYVYWPNYDSSTKQLLELTDKDSSITIDNHREGGMKFIAENWSEMEF